MDRRNAEGAAAVFCNSAVAGAYPHLRRPQDSECRCARWDNLGYLYICRSRGVGGGVCGFADMESCRVGSGVFVSGAAMGGENVGTVNGRFHGKTVDTFLVQQEQYRD